MSKFADRDMITEKILSILTPEYSVKELHDAKVTWWKNFRNTGGYGLTVAGARAFEQADLDFVEFDDGPSDVMLNNALGLLLDSKMVTPYYFYIADRRRKIRIYDSRVVMLIGLYDTVSAYLQSLERRPK